LNFSCAFTLRLGSIEEQEYYSDILLGIKAVIQSHIKGLQDRFQDKYVSLELEVQQRDEMITDLQSRLRDYESNSGMTPIRESERDMSGSTGSSAELPFMVIFNLIQSFLYDFHPFHSFIHLFLVLFSFI